MLTILLALTVNSYAVPDVPLEVFEQICEIECKVDGWRLEIAESTTDNKFVLSFVPQDAVWRFGDNLYQAGDTLIATDAEPVDGYCVQYPISQPHSIIGNVWERYPTSTYTSMATTPPLTFLASIGDPCQMDINDLLGVVDLHKVEVHADVPTSCGDQDCLSGNGGIDPQDPGSGPWSQQWIYYDGEVFTLEEWQDFVDPGNEEPPVDVEELLEDKQPAENQSGNSGNSNGGGPPEPVKEENP